MPVNYSTIKRVSTDSIGAQAYSNSTQAVFSADGGKVAFTSVASNLVPGDTNSVRDIFVKNLANDTVYRVSTDANGNQANGGSLYPVWSPDGTKIAFTSQASNLVLNDTNLRYDIFVKDIVSGAIERVSTGVGGTQASDTSLLAVFSPNGQKIAFVSDANDLVVNDTNSQRDIFVKELSTGSIVRVSTSAVGSQANFASETPIFSPDGTKVAFHSRASNLVGGDTNNNWDVFVKTLATGAITRVSTSSTGTQATGIP